MKKNVTPRNKAEPSNKAVPGKKAAPRGKYAVPSSEQDGEEFEVTDVRVFADVKMRQVVAYSVIGLMALFLCGAAVYGMVIHDFSGLHTVYDNLKVPGSLILTYYFSRKT